MSVCLQRAALGSGDGTFDSSEDDAAGERVDAGVGDVGVDVGDTGCSGACVEYGAASAESVGEADGVASSAESVVERRSIRNDSGIQSRLSCAVESRGDSGFSGALWWWWW